MFQRNSAPAKGLARKAAELDPMYFFPVMVDGWTDLEVGKFREAIPALRKAKAMESPPFVTAYLAFAYGAAGDREAAMVELASSRKSHGMARYCRSTWRLCTSVLATAPARSTTSSGPSRPIRR
jgi:predicted Zn-dependent protease